MNKFITAPPYGTSFLLRFSLLQQSCRGQDLHSDPSAGRGLRSQGYLASTAAAARAKHPARDSNP
jgi:hypothetical protein